MDLGFYEACKSMGLSDTQYRGLSKVAMEKLAAVDAQDHANAIDVGFVDACRAMKLNDADTRALHKVASERVEAFLQKKHAADAKVK
jgi:3-methyladenine DNA glycosylase AlkD